MKRKPGRHEKAFSKADEFHGQSKKFSEAETILKNILNGLSVGEDGLYVNREIIDQLLSDGLSFPLFKEVVSDSSLSIEAIETYSFRFLILIALFSSREIVEEYFKDIISYEQVLKYRKAFLQMLPSNVANMSYYSLIELGDLENVLERFVIFKDISLVSFISTEALNKSSSFINFLSNFFELEAKKLKFFIFFLYVFNVQKGFYAAKNLLVESKESSDYIEGYKVFSDLIKRDPDIKAILEKIVSIIKGLNSLEASIYEKYKLLIKVLKYPDNEGSLIKAYSDICSKYSYVPNLLNALETEAREINSLSRIINLNNVDLDSLFFSVQESSIPIKKQVDLIFKLSKENSAFFAYQFDGFRTEETTNILFKFINSMLLAPYINFELLDHPANKHLVEELGGSEFSITNFYESPLFLESLFLNTYLGYMVVSLYYIFSKYSFFKNKAGNFNFKLDSKYFVLSLATGDSYRRAKEIYDMVISTTYDDKYRKELKDYILLCLDSNRIIKYLESNIQVKNFDNTFNIDDINKVLEELERSLYGKLKNFTILLRFLKDTRYFSGGLG